MPLSKERLETALRSAHDAGDAEAARKIAATLKAGDYAKPVEKGVMTYVEPAMTVASGMAAEPVAGIAGIGAAMLGGPKAGADMVETYRDAMTYRPRTEQGKSGLAGLAETMRPLTDAVEKVETAIGDAGYDVGGPIGGAIGKTTPTAALMALGAGPVRRGIKSVRETSKQAKLAKDAAPSLEQLKEATNAAYRSLDDSGAVVGGRAISRLNDRLSRIARKEGYDVDLHPKVAAGLKRYAEAAEMGDMPIGEVEILRRVMNQAKGSIEKGERRLAGVLIDEIDNTMDSLNIIAPDGVNIGKQYRHARGLSHRANKVEAIDDMIANAKTYESGFERGLANQFRNFLRNKKKQRGFTKDELEAMQKVIDGGNMHTILKTLGKLGFSGDQATRLLLPSLGVAAGSSVGGTAGAVAVPALGTLSQRLATKLTRNNAEAARRIAASGKNAEAIMAEYFRAVKPEERSAVELTELLLSRDANVGKLSQSINTLPDNVRPIAADVVYLTSFIGQEKNRKQAIK